MTLVDTYAPHLPFLRRFARALTGSQSEGDKYVRATLQAFVSGDEGVVANLSPKATLYRMFLSIWNATGAVLEKDANDNVSPAERIRRLKPRSREAFLLSALEGMSTSEIAQIMGVSDSEAGDLISAAEADIETELRTNVLIIEDEPLIAADIKNLVTDLGHSVDAITTTRSEAMRSAKNRKPGLVLADIQLADGSSGIDAVDDILSEYDVPVIFITGVPELLLTGEKDEPAYLISKPFKPGNVKAAISQALFFRGSASSS